MRQQIKDNRGSFIFSIILIILQPIILTKLSFTHLITNHMRGDAIFTWIMIGLLCLFAFLFWKTFTNAGKTYAKNHLMIVASLLALFTVAILLNSVKFRDIGYLNVLLVLLIPIVLFNIFQSSEVIQLKNKYLSWSLRTVYIFVYCLAIYIFFVFSALTGCNILGGECCC